MRRVVNKKERNVFFKDWFIGDTPTQYWNCCTAADTAALCLRREALPPLLWHGVTAYCPWPRSLPYARSEWGYPSGIPKSAALLYRLYTWCASSDRSGTRNPERFVRGVCSMGHDRRRESCQWRAHSVASDQCWRCFLPRCDVRSATLPVFRLRSAIW